MSKQSDEDLPGDSKVGLFETLAHPVRIRMLEALKERPMGFSELKRAVGIESSGHLQFHLSRLEGFVSTNSDGDYVLTDDGREALRLVMAVESTHGERPKPWYRRHAVSLALVLTIVVIAGVGLYQVLDAYSARYVQVSVDLTQNGDRGSWSVENLSPSTVRSLEILVNGSNVVNFTGEGLYPNDRAGGVIVLPDGVPLAYGQDYNLTVTLNFTNGQSSVKSTRTGAFTGVTLYFRA